MVKVKALETYQKYLVKDEQLGCIPEKGRVFEVDEKRLKVLLGENDHKRVFVEVINNLETVEFVVRDKELNNYFEQQIKSTAETLEKSGGLSEAMTKKSTNKK